MDDGFEKNTIPLLMLLCYSLALLMILYYFAKEDSILHYSRRVESLFLTCVLSLVYFSSVHFGWNYIAWWNENSPPSEDTEELLKLDGLRTLRHLVLVLVLYTIGANLVSMRVLPRFYDMPGYGHARREAKMHNIVTSYPDAIKIAAEVNNTVNSIARLDTLLVLDPMPAGIAIMVLLLLSELTDVSKDGWGVKAAIVFGDACQVLVIILIFTMFMRRCLSMGALVKHLNDEIETLVHYRKEPHLAYVLATVSVPSLMEVSKEMLSILTEQALDAGMLDTTTKAIIIDGLQRAGLGKASCITTPRRQEAVKRIIQKTKGVDLTKLKNYIDSRGGYHNLYKLVYVDISDDDIRRTVLEHLEKEADSQSRPMVRPVKVLSDLDDTLFSSGGKFPAGCDKRIPKGVVYPGVLTLFKCLDKSFDPVRPTCNIVFLSARPHIYSNWMEEKSYDLFRDLADQERIHTFPTLLPGRLKSGLYAMLAHCWHRRNKTEAWKEVGERKAEMFADFKRLYSEYDFIFCGDDGQGDLLAAQRMLERERRREYSSSSGSESDFSEDMEMRTNDEWEQLPREDSEDLSSDESPIMSSPSGGATPLRKEGRLKAVLIHEVAFQDGCQPLALQKPHLRGGAWYEDLKQQHVVFHKSYLGAAMDLHCSHPHLVSIDDLEEVGRQAVKELGEVMMMYPDEELGRADFMQDRERANIILVKAGKQPLGEPKALEHQPPMGPVSSSECLNGGVSLAGAGELRKNYVDLLPNDHQANKRRRRRQTVHAG